MLWGLNRQRELVLPLWEGPPLFRLGPLVRPNPPNPLQVSLRGDSQGHVRR